VSCIYQKLYRTLFWFQDLESDAAKAFIEVASGIDDVPFGVTSNKDLFKEYDVEKDDAVVLFKKVCLSSFCFYLKFMVTY